MSRQIPANFGHAQFGGTHQSGYWIALTRAGFDLVLANSIKVIIILTMTVVALPVFIVQGKVHWIPALVLAAGFTLGGWLGAHVAVRGGEKLIRVVMVFASIALAAKLLGAFG